MIAGNPLGNGFRPVAIYARRARKPLLKNLSDDPSISSWEMLGTNLSVKLSEDAAGNAQFTTEAQRLLLMDRKDFNSLGIGVDDLIDAYVQTVMSVIAIDRMCQRLMTEDVSEKTVQRPLTEEEKKLEAAELTQPRLLVSASSDCETRTRKQITAVKDTENGERVATEVIRTTERRFDLALFEALNPDKALLQEITL